MGPLTLALTLLLPLLPCVTVVLDCQVIRALVEDAMKQNLVALHSLQKVTFIPARPGMSLTRQPLIVSALMVG